MASFAQLTVQELLGIDVVLSKLNHILGVVSKMSTQLETLDAVLAAFSSDLDTALASIQAKLDQLEQPLDLSSEVGMIQAAQARLDAFVLANAPTPATEPTVAEATAEPAPAETFPEPGTEPEAPAA